MRVAKEADMKQVCQGRYYADAFQSRGRGNCLGELVHMESSEHAWLILSYTKQTIIALQEDDTGYSNMFRFK